MLGLWWRIIQFGFRLLYNELAWTYDWVSWSVSLGHWRDWQRVCLRYVESAPSSPILELAHGTADLQIDMAREGRLGVGLDLSRAMGRVARTKLLRAGIVPRLVRASAMDLPFGNESFHDVVSTFPTEFVMQKRTIKEIYRILQPGGRLVIVLNGMLTVTHPIARLLEWLYQITGQRAPLPADSFRGFQSEGLEPHLHVDSLPDSETWVLVAQKGLMG